MALIATLTIHPTVDVSTAVDQVVADRKLRCGPPRRDPGGGGINVARVAHRLGADTVAVYPVGGPSGAILRQLMEREGIESRCVETEGWTRQNLAVTETGSGRQYRFGMPGPELADREWQACLAAVEELEPRPDYLVASGSLGPGVPDDFYARLAPWAAANGVRLVVDTSGDALRLAAGAGVELLKPNLRELGQLAGDGESVHRVGIATAARRLIDSGGARAVVVSLGAAGALLVTPGACQRVPSPTVPIESRIGAGDSTTAGIVAALARGDELLDAVRYGVAAGAATVTTPGTELCHREDVERLYRSTTS